jgi:hypothetical protein
MLTLKEERISFNTVFAEDGNNELSYHSAHSQ